MGIRSDTTNLDFPTMIRYCVSPESTCRFHQNVGKPRLLVSLRSPLRPLPPAFYMVFKCFFKWFQEMKKKLIMEKCEIIYKNKQRNKEEKKQR